ncbi:DeoR/GlpR transcriptional regulator, partial [Vibrio vulnificus]|nr:DeoR/GlpR transcriptional regulator [Vibrio vulnificus]
NYEIKKTFIEVSEKVILLADKSKYKKKSLLRICGLDEIDLLISNAAINTKI